ncbi:MAG: beta-ketoacyl synthase [Tannerella sp.]|jgi:3-oxoacyl-[acyl-carrier-protein] synthase-1|nr:beta-ketoacyl synthase [Tannerella sp.]
MITLLSDNIISALGFTSGQNFENVRQGISGITYYPESYFNLHEPFMASAIDSEALDRAFYRLPFAPETNCTKLEKAAIVSVSEALKETAIDASSKRTLFILSSTKGNVFLLDSTQRDGYEPEQLFLWRSAELIAGYFGNKNTPLVVSNACISGASALITAQRALLSKRYDHVIVTGADMLSRFVVSGFQSFKALSQEVCKPFDAERNGLNIGESASTMILADTPGDKIQSGQIVLSAGAVRNDANHISGPSRTGEGSFLALKHVLSGTGTDEIAFVNAHGTATPYNDEMESVAITRASLQDVPITCQKGYFGHTLGSAGILESIISTRALRNGIILKTYGFNTLGVTNPLHVTQQVQTTSRNRCINMLSGFGGCNAALLYTLVKN